MTRSLHDGGGTDSDWHTGKWSAWCDCGWTGHDHRRQHQAKAELTLHQREAKAMDNNHYE